MRYLAALAVFSILSLAPFAAHAANLPLFNPDFRIVPDPHEYDPSCPVGAPLSFGAVMQTVQNLMNVAISVGVLVMIFAIVVTGFQLVMSATNPHGKEEARKRFGSVFIGFLVVISAWLVVDFIMKTLYNPDTNDGRRWGPWNEIITADSNDWCIKEGETKAIIDASVIGVLTGRSGPGSSGGGRCLAQDSGACASSNMSAFGDMAETASRVCYGESTGNASAESTTDKLGDGTPYSFGLFQINITAHRINNLNCPSAFSRQNCTLRSCGRGTGVRVTDVELYNQCRAAAKNPATNIAKAVEIFNDASRRWSPTWGAATRCGISVKATEIRVAFDTIVP